MKLTQDEQRQYLIAALSPGFRAEEAERMVPGSNYRALKVPLNGRVAVLISRG